MHDYRYDHVHLRSPDPDATARFFETMFGAEVTRSIYPPGTLYPGQQRITMRLGGQTVLIAPPHPHEATATAPPFPHYGLEPIWAASGGFRWNHAACTCRSRWDTKSRARW